MTTYGLLIFDGAEELDFTGPWEVFTVSAMLRDHGDTAVLIAGQPGAVRCAKGMRVLTGHQLRFMYQPGRIGVSGRKCRAGARSRRGRQLPGGKGTAGLSWW